jgi:hypothetical protein
MAGESVQIKTSAPMQDAARMFRELMRVSWRFSPDGEAMAGLVCRVGCFVELKDRHRRTYQRVNQP